MTDLNQNPFKDFSTYIALAARECMKKTQHEYSEEDYESWGGTWVFAGPFFENKVSPAQFAKEMEKMTAFCMEAQDDLSTYYGCTDLFFEDNQWLDAYKKHDGDPIKLVEVFAHEYGLIQIRPF
jgi:hypothetical protein